MALFRCSSGGGGGINVKKEVLSASQLSTSNWYSFQCDFVPKRAIIIANTSSYSTSQVSCIYADFENETQFQYANGYFDIERSDLYNTVIQANGNTIKYIATNQYYLCNTVIYVFG